jgi:hypothetical protein
MTHRLCYSPRTPIDPCWRNQPCRVLARAKGPGARNVLVETAVGIAVVPWRNVRRSRP